MFGNRAKLLMRKFTSTSSSQVPSPSTNPPSSFQGYPDLPYDLRHNIRRLVILDAEQDLPYRKLDCPISLQSGIHLAPRPFTLANLACVNEELVSTS